MFQFEIKVGYVHNMCNTTKYTYKMNPFDIVLFIFNDSSKLDVQMMNLTEFLIDCLLPGQKGFTIES